MSNTNYRTIILIACALTIALIYIILESNKKSNKKRDTFENFSENTGKSPLLNNNKNDYLDTYSQLMTQFDTDKDSSNKQKLSVYSDGKQYNKNQKLLESPPSKRNFNHKEIGNKIASPYTNKQQVYPGDNQKLDYQ